jgi:uncharacterized protein (DUF885 family)
MAEKKSVRMDLYKAGVVADLSFSVWGAWAKLKEDDLGLSGVPEDIISLGHKKLAKKENLKEIDTVVHKARNLFKTNSFAFPFGGARFIPYARLQKVVAKMQEAENNFNMHKEVLFKEYPAIKEKMMKEYDEAFEKLLKQKSTSSDEVIKEQKKKLLARLEDKYPTLSELRNRFAFDFVIFEISDPEFKRVSTDKALNKVLKLDAMEKAYREKVSTRLDGFVEEVIASLKKMVLETVKKIQERIDKDTVKMSTIRSFKKFAETFREMDFVDMNIDSVLKALEDKIKDVDKSQLSDEKFKEIFAAQLNAIKEAAEGVDYDKTLGRFKRMLRVEAQE